MNTCKAALRILKARKLYVIIYLVLIGTMMFSISWQIMRGSTAARATTYEPESARIAVIDRDDDAEHVAQSLRSYLALDGEMVTIDDDSISLQQAVASNYVDLIAIVPQGFAERYLQYADNATATQPTIDTVVSYASGAGSLAQLKVNEFLSLTRTAYLGMPQAQRTLDAAMVTTLDAATADMKQSHIAVVSSDSEDDGTTPGSSAFAGTLKTGLYPLLLVMPVCTFLVVSTFNDNEIRRRLYSVLKSAASGKHAPLNQAVPLDPSFFDANLSFANADPEVLLIDREKAASLLENARKLLSEFEVKILGYYLDGLTCREIAETVGKSPKSVDNAVQRIRRNIAW